MDFWPQLCSLPGHQEQKLGLETVYHLAMSLLLTIRLLTQDG